MHQNNQKLLFQFFLLNLLIFDSFFLEDDRSVFTEETFINDRKLVLNWGMQFFRILFILVSELIGQFISDGLFLAVQLGIPAAFKTWHWFLAFLN